MKKRKAVGFCNQAMVHADIFQETVIIPWCACAARDTVIVLSVC